MSSACKTGRACSDTPKEATCDLPAALVHSTQGNGHFAAPQLHILEEVGFLHGPQMQEATLALEILDGVVRITLVAQSFATLAQAPELDAFARVERQSLRDNGHVGKVRQLVDDERDGQGASSLGACVDDARHGEGHPTG